MKAKSFLKTLSFCKWNYCRLSKWFVKNRRKYMEKIINELTKLTESIELPEVVAEHVQKKAKTIPAEYFEHWGRKLLDARTAKNAAKELDEKYQEDNFTALAIYLYAASLSWEKIYRPLNIPKEIYIDTMKAFSRFIQEYYEAAAVYQFNRGFWIWRQISGLIFRIGELEYELTKFPQNDKKAELAGKESLSVHIPSDADLSPEKITNSYHQAAVFFRLYFPRYQYQAIYTDTWLLSPNLSTWLKPESKIRRFADNYELLTVDETNDSGVPWIFKRADAQIQDYPEKTSLQRQAKKQLLAGKHIGAGLGILSI
jgi:hypothetical protein